MTSPTGVDEHPGESGADAASWRGRRAELLAVSDPDELVRLADRCLATNPDHRVTTAPRLGLVPLCVREPVRGERFIVADVLVTEAAVEVGEHQGWAMRLGDEPLTALAAAICDAAAEARDELGSAVTQLCLVTERQLEADDLEEWQELAQTEVHFEEMP